MKIDHLNLQRKRHKDGKQFHGTFHTDIPVKILWRFFINKACFAKQFGGVIGRPGCCLWSQGWTNIFYSLIVYASFSLDAISLRSFHWRIHCYFEHFQIMCSAKSNQLMGFFECFMSPLRELFPAYYQLEWEKGRSIKPRMAFCGTPI